MKYVHSEMCPFPEGCTCGATALNEKDHMEGKGRTREQVAADHRELEDVAPTPADKFKLMFQGPLAVQQGGTHYRDMAIQPVDYIQQNQLGYIEGNVVKYVSRWKVKGGVDDLRKARHYLDILIEMEAKKAKGATYASGSGES